MSSLPVNQPKIYVVPGTGGIRVAMKRLGRGMISHVLKCGESNERGLAALAEFERAYVAVFGPDGGGR